jgi:phenylalanyl-tRNA synthetase beta chain
MPKITVEKNDLYRLAGLEEDYPLEMLEADLALVKGELKRIHHSGDEAPGDEQVRIELSDTNRPDLWCVEGIARQLRDHRAGCGREYPFYTREPAELRIVVDARLKDIRPYIGGFLATGGAMDESGLLAFIEGQETLDRNFGRKRKAVSIGLYSGAAVRFPVQYRAVERSEVLFEPLAPAGTLKDGATWPAGLAMTPQEILKKHPTGQEYAWTLEGFERVPLLTDAEWKVLSLIPIINSAGLGRVTPGMDSLFVEATGTDLDQVLLTLNILATNLNDRGWTIQPVTVEYPYDTPRGRLVTAPQAMPITQRAPLEMFDRLLGEKQDGEDIVQKLTAYGVRSALDGDAVLATIPSYRQDYLHPVDVMEDFAISRGFMSFAPLLPEDFTTGGLNPLTGFEDLLRDLMIGFGGEEAICITLSNDGILRQRMEVGMEMKDSREPFHGGPLVRISNVMNANCSTLRDWVLPSLLEVESHSEGALYPHYMFEVGEVAVFDPRENLGSRTESRLAMIIADEAASFDSVQSVLYALLNSLKVTFLVVPWEHPSFIPGRVALVLKEGGSTTNPSSWLGFLGEFSPQVLTNWGARMPVAGMELVVEKISQSVDPSISEQ